LDTPVGTVAEINESSASQRAEPTDEENVFTLLVNEENLAGLSRIYGAFNLVEIESYPFGIVVSDQDGTRTSVVGITVSNEDGDVFTGDYNQYLQWFADEELPVGVYTITLDT